MCFKLFVFKSLVIFIFLIYDHLSKIVIWIRHKDLKKIYNQQDCQMLQNLVVPNACERAKMTLIICRQLILISAAHIDTYTKFCWVLVVIFQLSQCALKGKNNELKKSPAQYSRLPRRASKRKKIPHLRFWFFWAQKYLYFSEQLKLKSKPGKI